MLPLPAMLATTLPLVTGVVATVITDALLRRVLITSAATITTTIKKIPAPSQRPRLTPWRRGRVAVAIEDGLIIPVVRFADQKTLSQIAAETKDLAGRAKNKKLQPNEWAGNTFTISNLGMMDVDEFTAIINPPDSAIMAVGRIKEVVVKKGDGFGVSNMMKVTLSADHRTLDGAVGAAFLQTFKRYLENPVTMLV